MKRIVVILCALSGFTQAHAADAATTQKLTSTANIYLVNVMPFPLTLSYTIGATVPQNAVTQGPAIVQPGQTVKALQYIIPYAPKSTQPYEFTTNVNGTIPETSAAFSVSLSQRIINNDNTPTFEYSMVSANPAFKDEWITPEKYQTRKITLGQADIFFDYTARKNITSIDVYYCIAPKQIAFNSDTMQAIVGKDFKTIDQLAPRVWKEMFSTSASAIKQLDAWIPARPEIRYDQTSFLGSHASFANTQAGFLYAKQLWSIKQQLDNGVRAFQLSIYPDGDNPAQLCLGDCATTQFLRAGTNITALETLKILRTWLDANKNEVVTIILDTKLTADAMLKLIDQSGLTPLLLTKKLWEPLTHSGAWPRIGWMQLYQQRVVIFDRSENNPDQYGYSAKQYLIQNTPGTLDITQAAQLAGSVVKPTPHLFQCNYYGTITAPLPLQNTSEQIKKLLEAIRNNKYLEQNQAPNFIMLDHVEMGNPMTLINEINKAAQSQ